VKSALERDAHGHGCPGSAQDPAAQVLSTRHADQDTGQQGKQERAGCGLNGKLGATFPVVSEDVVGSAGLIESRTAGSGLTP
jgi:hypothetical protein